MHQGMAEHKTIRANPADQAIVEQLIQRLARRPFSYFQRRCCRFPAKVGEGQLPGYP